MRVGGNWQGCQAIVDSLPPLVIHRRPTVTRNPSNFLRVHRGDHASDSAKLSSKRKQFAHGKRALVTAGDAHRLAAQANELADQLQAQQSVIRQQQIELAVRATLAAGPSQRPDPSDAIDRLMADATLATGTTAAAVYLLDDETEYLATRFVFGLSPSERLGTQRPLRGARGDLEAMVHGLIAIEDTNLGPVDSWRTPEPFPAGICVCLGDSDMPIGTMWLFAEAAMAFTDVHTAAARLAASNLQQTLQRLAEQDAAPDSSIRLILPSDVTHDRSRDVSPPSHETHDDAERTRAEHPTREVSASVDADARGAIPPGTAASATDDIGSPPADESGSAAMPHAELSQPVDLMKAPSDDSLDGIDDEKMLDAALESAIEEELAKSEELIAELQRDYEANPQEYVIGFDTSNTDVADWGQSDSEDAPAMNDLGREEDAEQWPLLSSYDEETMRLAAKLDLQDAQFLSGNYDPSEVDQFDADAMEFHHGWDEGDTDGLDLVAEDAYPFADDDEDDLDWTPNVRVKSESETIDAINDIVALIDDFDADFPSRAPERDNDQDSILTNRRREAEETQAENESLANQVSIWQHQTLPMGAQICPSWYIDGMIESPLDVAQSWHHWDILPDGQIALAICQPNGGATPKIDLGNVMDVTVVRSALQSHMGYRHQPSDAVRRAYDTLFQIRDQSFAGIEHGNVSLLYAHIDPETGETRMASTGDWSTLAISKFGYRPVGWLDRESDANHRDLGNSDLAASGMGNIDIINSHLYLQQGEVFLVTGRRWMGLQPIQGTPGYPQHQIGTAITKAMREGKVRPLAALREWMMQTTLDGERTAMALHRFGS